MKIQRYIPITIAIIILLSVSYLFLSNSKIDPNRLPQLKKDAEVAFTVKDYSNSLKSYLTITDEFPKDSDGYIGLVKVLLIKNIMDKAEVVASGSKGKIDDKTVSAIYIQIGDKYYQNNDIENTAKSYKIAYDLDSQNQELMVKNFECALKLGKLQDAKLYSNLNTEVSLSFMKSELFNAYMLLDEQDKAKEYVTKIDTLDLLSKKEIADATLSNGLSLKEAFISYKSALQTSIDNKDNKIYVSTLLAREYIRSGFPRLAIYLLESKEEQFNNYYDGLYFLALAYYDAGEYAKALEVNSLVEKAGFDTYEMQLITARASTMTGDISNANKYYERSIQFAPDDLKVRYMFEYEKVLSDQKLYSKANSILNSIETKGDSAELRVAYVDLYFQSNELEKIPVHLERLITYANDKNNYARFIFVSYAKIAIEKKDALVAKEKLDALAKYGQDDAEYCYLMGRYYLLISDKGLADKYFSYAVQYDLVGDVSIEAQKEITK